jgi:hypothetical protein
MNKNLIEQKASDLLESYNLMSSPVKVNKLIGKLGIELAEVDLGDEISGVLVVENGKARIGYHGNCKTRNRFTLAHELGHYILHVNNKNELFVDNVKVMYRKQAASRIQKMQEIEANSFAAALLMPRKLIKQKIDKLKDEFFFLTDEEIIESLSNDFKVSTTAMTYRLINLKLIENYSMY